MNVQNLPQNVPVQVKNLFYNCIPWGSDYVIYCSSYSSASQVYDLYFSTPVTHIQHHFYITHSTGGDYILHEDSQFNTSFDGYFVSYPYYCYSSVQGQGLKESLPCTNDIICFMLIVCASLLVLKTVFGGIKLWSERKKFVA